MRVYLFLVCIIYPAFVIAQTGDYDSTTIALSQEINRHSAQQQYDSLLISEQNLLAHLHRTAQYGLFWKVFRQHSNRYYQGIKPFEAWKRMIQTAHIKWAKPAPLSEGLADFYTRSGYCFYKNKQLDSAAWHYQKSMALYRELGLLDSLQTVNLFNNYSLNLMRNGQYQQAFYWCERALRIFEGNDSLEQAYSGVYNNLAIITKRVGEYEQALFYTEKANKLLGKQYEKHSSLRSRFNQAVTYVNMAVYQNTLEDFEAALSAAHAGIAIYQEQGWDYDGTFSSLRYEEARAYLGLGKLSEAKQIAAELEGVGKQRAGRRGAQKLIRSLDLYAKVARAKGEYQEALGFFKASKQLLASVQPNIFDFQAERLREQGELHSLCQQYDSALYCFQKSIAINTQEQLDFEAGGLPQAPENVFNQYEMILSLNALGDYWLRRHENSADIAMAQKALDTYMHAIAFGKDMLTQLSGDNPKLFLSKKAWQVYRGAINAAQQCYQATKDPQYLSIIFKLMDESKSNVVYRNVVAAYHQRKGFGTVAENKAFTLRRQLNEVQNELIGLKKNVDNNQDALYDSLSQQLLDLGGQLRAIEQQNSLEADSWASSGQNVFNLEVVQRTLQADQLLLSYFDTGEGFLLMAVAPKAVKLYDLGEVSEKVAAYKSAIMAHEPALFAPAAFELYEALLQPALSDFPQAQKLMAIPDGPLYTVPFVALLTEGASVEQATGFDGLPYLLKSYAYTMHTSARLWLWHKSHTKQNTADVMAFAPFAEDGDATQTAQLRDAASWLPYSSEEANLVIELTGGRLFMGERATETNFVRNMGRAAVLHLATHAEVDSRSPEFSRFIFNRDGQNDGQLHLYELYGLSGNAEMAVLNACNTGLGKYQEGEGLIGFARGFLYMGVPNVLVSLWPLSDRSSYSITESFYKFLLDGEGKSEALRLAQLAYLEKADAKWSDPFYWAGVSLIGDHAPLRSVSSFSWVWQAMGALSLVTLLIVAILYFRKKLS